MIEFSGIKTPAELLGYRFEYRIRRECDGTCCECGTCCDRVLMLTPTEIRMIHRFLKKHTTFKKEILKQYPDYKTRLVCPFLDTSKPNHKCRIYGDKSYPLICSTYNCDESKMNQMEVFMAYSTKFKGELPVYVDMWHEFFGDPDDLAESWHYHDTRRFNLIPPEHIRKYPLVFGKCRLLGKR